MGTLAPASGQMVNSVSADKTGMYYFAIDTLIQILNTKNLKPIDRIILQADNSILEDWPNTIQGKSIIKDDNTKGIRIADLKKNDVVFKIKGITIIREQITLSIGTYERRDKGLTFFDDGVHIFYFKFLPESRTYKLTKLKSGVIL